MMKNSAGMMWYDSNSTRRACPCLSEQSLPRFRDVRRRLLGQLDTYAHGPTRPGLARRCNCNQQGAKAVEGSGTGFAPHAVNAVDCRASGVCTAPGHRVSMHGCRYDRAGRKQERTVSWRPPRLVRAPCERSTVCCLLRSCLGAFIVQLLCVSARALREAGVLVHSGTLRTSGRVVSLNGWMRMTRLAVGPAARRRNSVEPVRGRTHATHTTPRATRTTCARSPSLCPRVGYTCHPMDGV